MALRLRLNALRCKRLLAARLGLAAGDSLFQKYIDIEATKSKRSEQITATSFRVARECDRFLTTRTVHATAVVGESRPECSGSGKAGGTKEFRCAEWEPSVDSQPSLRKL